MQRHVPKLPFQESTKHICSEYKPLRSGQPCHCMSARKTWRFCNLAPAHSCETQFWTEAPRRPMVQLHGLCWVPPVFSGHRWLRLSRMMAAREVKRGRSAIAPTVKAYSSPLGKTPTPRASPLIGLASTASSVLAGVPPRKSIKRVAVKGASVADEFACGQSVLIG